MNTSLMSIQNLSAWYDSEKNILSNFSLELKEHEAVGLIGLNGAGKTTLLNVISGLHTMFRSEGAWFCGRPIGFREKEFKLCRYTVFSEDDSFGYFTFREYLSYVCLAYQKELSDVSELIRGFHFEEFTDILMKDLSTGNHKKAFLIAAFALKPELLFLDEPVNGLDFESTEYLYRQIAGYKEYGTVLFSSHILESITLTSDRVLVLEHGKIRRILEKEEMNDKDIRGALHEEHDMESFF